MHRGLWDPAQRDRPRALWRLPGPRRRAGSVCTSSGYAIAFRADRASKPECSQRIPLCGAFLQGRFRAPPRSHGMRPSLHKALQKRPLPAALPQGQRLRRAGSRTRPLPFCRLCGCSVHFAFYHAGPELPRAIRRALFLSKVYHSVFCGCQCARCRPAGQRHFHFSKEEKEASGRNRANPIRSGGMTNACPPGEASSAPGAARICRE